MSVVNKKLTDTILSMSLLTVMAGAAIAPALGVIKAHFAEAPELLVQFIVSIPALFIIITNLFFLDISRHYGTRTIALLGLMLYVVAGAGCFFAGMAFGQLMNIFREPMKYLAPIFFLVGYTFCAIAHSLLPLLVGAVFTGIANGVGVPYLNTIASIKGGRNSATTVMPLLSAALYMGQFLSPIIVTPLSRWLFGEQYVAGAYKTGIMLCLVFLVQVYTTRHYQSLPPKENGQQR